MKSFLVLLISLCCSVAYTQNSNYNSPQSLSAISNNNATNFGAYTFFSNSSKIIERSLHLFTGWNNNAVIQTLDGKKFTITNINLNLQRNTFESKISKDSLFTFNFNRIDKFIVNNKIFKNFYYNDDNRVYEIIYESESLMLIQGFEIQLLEGSANPMLNRKNDKYVKKQSYYTREGEVIKSFKLNRKTLIRLFKDDMVKVAKIENYIKTNKLSSNQEAIDLGSNLNQEFDVNVNNSTQTVSNGLSGISSHGASFYFTNPKRRVDGTFYLFENWRNNATIYINNAQNFTLKNINLNLKRNTFETKVAADSLFTFNFNNIEKFVINNKVYKNYYYDEDNRVCEVIFEAENFSILKGFKVELIEGSANPMVNRTADKYVRKHYYFLKSENTVKPFKLRKSRILKLIDANNTSQVLEYIDRNNLSFKKEIDVRKILEFNNAKQLANHEAKKKDPATKKKKILEDKVVVQEEKFNARKNETNSVKTETAKTKEKAGKTALKEVTEKPEVKTEEKKAATLSPEETKKNTLEDKKKKIIADRKAKIEARNAKKEDKTNATQIASKKLNPKEAHKKTLEDKKKKIIADRKAKIEARKKTQDSIKKANKVKTI